MKSAWLTPLYTSNHLRIVLACFLKNTAVSTRIIFLKFLLQIWQFLFEMHNESRKFHNSLFRSALFKVARCRQTSPETNKKALFLFGTYPNSPIIPECRDFTCCQCRGNCQAGHVIRVLAVGVLPHQS